MKNKIILERESLIEMYKAGFLDGHGKPKTIIGWKELNKKYRKAFIKRFEKPINKILKEKKKNASVSIRKRKV